MNKVAKTGIAALCLWGAWLCAAHAMERIGALHSDIRIASSGELSVTETIEVQASGREAQRGIVRHFPAAYRDRLGRRVKLRVVIDKVLRNGRAEPYVLERTSSGTRVRTGDPARPLARGKHVYQIAYRSARQIRFLDQHDELNWNVAGGLALAFERLSAEVSFERAVPAADMKLEAYTGGEGARAQDYHAFVREGSAAFRATRALAPGEGMSIVVAFPKGTLVAPSPLTGDPAVPVGAAVLALMAALLAACRIRFVRSRARASSAAVPEGVGPGGVRFIDRGRYDERCLGAAILGLQARGYLRIRERGERFRLQRTGEDIEWFPGEEALARRLLRDADAEMRRHGRAMDEAGRAFSRALLQAFGRRAWASEGSFVLAAAGIGIAGLLAMLALDGAPAAIAVIGGAMLAVLAIFGLKLLPVFTTRGRAHQPDIDALRSYLASAEPKNEEEFSRLLPYAVALELENVWGRRFVQSLPSNLIGFSARGPDRALAPPTRPLRHRRSAAA